MITCVEVSNFMFFSLSKTVGSIWFVLFLTVSQCEYFKTKTTRLQIVQGVPNKTLLRFNLYHKSLECFFLGHLVENPCGLPSAPFADDTVSNIFYNKPALL